MLKYFKLMRVRHYIKNMLIFLPIIFSGQLFDSLLLQRVGLGFVSFSLVASAIYILNDIHDLQHDRIHGSKRNRPIASGKISVGKASLLAFMLGTAAVCINFLIRSTWQEWICLLIYFSINLAYSRGLKNIPLVDISIIVAGYLLRVTYGGMISGVGISSWMYLTVMALSFFFALGKRRNEIRRTGMSARAVLRHYSKEFLDRMMYVSLGLSLVFYSLWCLAQMDASSASEYIVWTVPIVMLICMRYSMNVEGDNDGDPAEVLLGDGVLLSLVTLYGIFIIFITYGKSFFQ